MSRFFRGHKRRGAFDLFSSYNNYMPGFGGVIMMLALLIPGVLLAAYVMELFESIYGAEATKWYGSLLSYPLLYAP